jgi:ATP-binding protein involved in chromosome partitioning
VQSIREGGDDGRPVALHTDSIVGMAFADLAEKVVQSVEHRNNTLPPTQQVEIKHN